MKDDSGSCAVFTERGPSASQMTAAEVMDIISRLPGCAGQAADAISTYTLVKMEDAPTLLKIPKSECPGIWIRLPKHQWPKSCHGPAWETLSFLLAGLLWKRQFEKSSGRRETGFEEQNIDPKCEVHLKEVDF